MMNSLSRSMITSTIAIAIYHLIGSSVVHAEVYGGPGDFGYRKSLPMHFVLDPGVLAQLGLKDEAASKVVDLQNRIQKEFEEEIAKAVVREGIGRQNSDELDSRVNRSKALFDRLRHQIRQPNPGVLHEVRNRHTEEINQLLTVDQQQRLYQIHLQNPTLSSDARQFRRAPSTWEMCDVLSDSEVAKELGLTEQQRRDIAAAHQVITRAEGNAVKGVRPKGPSYQDLKSKRSSQIMKVLTEEQWAKLRSILGDPYPMY